MSSAYPFSVSDTEFQGKRILVTGGTKGVGKAIVRRFQLSGARVAAAARSAPTTDAGSVTFIAADLGTTSGVDQVVARVQQLWGGLDILVNNAGAVDPKAGGFSSLTEDDWQNALNINLLASIRLDRGFLPGMRERKSGAIIHISSIVGHMPFADSSLSLSVAKAGLTAYSKGLAKAVASEGIQVNTISPGFIETDGARGMIMDISRRQNKTEDQARQMLTDMLGGIPVGSPGRPEEVAELVAFLTSPRARFISGTNSFIDGGSNPTV
jgi:NAD(P)-dependent dehydrogenase (short-subunit alcohol dehydrogenase family)